MSLLLAWCQPLNQRRKEGTGTEISPGCYAKKKRGVSVVGGKGALRTGRKLVLRKISQRENRN